MNMIDVELKGRFGQFIKAYLKNVLEDSAIIFYQEGEEDETVPLSEVRIVPSVGREVQPGQMAEVLFTVNGDQTSSQAGDTGGLLPGRWGDGSSSGSKSDAQLISPEASSSDRRLLCPAWWPCRVQKIRDEVAVVKLHVEPPQNATSADTALCTQLSTITDIVSRSTLRPPSDNSSVFLNSSMIHRHIIEMPKELGDYASDPNVHADFLRHCGGPASLVYNPETGDLTVLSTDADVVRKVGLLKETHVRMLRQKWAITRSLRQTMRNLEATRISDTVHPASTSARGSGDWDTEPGLFVENFYVPQHLMGLAIGAHGANIKAAREIDGVVRIRVREFPDATRCNGEGGAGEGSEYRDAALFIVEAKTAEAARQARARLEFTELYLGVPRRVVGRLIGRRTANILSIIDKSGVVHIHFDDHVDMPPNGEDASQQDNMGLLYTGTVQPPAHMRRVFLRAGGAQATSVPHADEDYGGFILAGTRESVERARLLINFQMDYIYDLEKMEAEKLELMRNLSHSCTSESSANIGPISRGFGRGGGASDGRWADRGMRGGGGRIGRRLPPRGVPMSQGENHLADEGMESQNVHGGMRGQLRDMRYDRPMRGPSGNRYRGRGAGRGGGGGIRRGGGGGMGRQMWNDGPTGSNGDGADHHEAANDNEAELQSGRDLGNVRGRPGSGASRYRTVPGSVGRYASDRDRGDETDEDDDGDDEFHSGGDATPLVNENGLQSDDAPRPRGAQRSGGRPTEHVDYLESDNPTYPNERSSRGPGGALRSAQTGRQQRSTSGGEATSGTSTTSGGGADLPSVEGSVKASSRPAATRGGPPGTRRIAQV